MEKATVMFVLLAFLLGGCTRDAVLARRCLLDSDSEVFQVISPGDNAGSGTVLEIAASIKTHKPGIYPFDVPTHGTADYRLVVNVDGQPVSLTGDPRPENLATTLARNPEEGEGIRYRFDTLLQISPGAHHVIVALPDDELALEKTIRLEEGTKNILRIEPVYGTTEVRQKPAGYGGSSFSQGIGGLAATLNNERI